MMRPYITALSGLLVLMLFQNCAPFAPTGMDSVQDSTASFSSVDPDFVCLPNQDPSPSDLRRLTKTQYTNTVRDLVRGLTAAERQTALTTILQTEPPDDQFTMFDRTDVSITKSHLNAYYLVASRFGDHITSNNALMEKFLRHYAALDTGGVYKSPFELHASVHFAEAHVGRDLSDPDESAHASDFGEQG